MNGKSYIFTSSKGGVGKTLCCINSLLSIKNKKFGDKDRFKDRNKSINVLVIDANSVNTDMFNILTKTILPENTVIDNEVADKLKLKSISKINQGKPEFKPVTSNLQTLQIDYTNHNGEAVKKWYVGLPLEIKQLKVFFCKNPVPFETSMNGYDFVSFITRLIETVDTQFESYFQKNNTVEMKDSMLDYILVDTNLHCGNFLYTNPGNEGSNEKIVQDLKKINASIMYFWTWNLFFKGEEYLFFSGLQNLKKYNYDTSSIYHIINAHSFLGNVANNSGISNEWRNISGKDFGAEYSIEEVIELCKDYIEKYLKYDNKNNFTHLQYLARSFTKKLKEDGLPKNIIVIPEFYFNIKSYYEWIQRGEQKSLKEIEELFRDNLLPIINKYRDSGDLFK